MKYDMQINGNIGPLRHGETEIVVGDIAFNPSRIYGTVTLFRRFVWWNPLTWLQSGIELAIQKSPETRKK